MNVKTWPERLRKWAEARLRATWARARVATGKFKPWARVKLKATWGWTRTKAKTVWAWIRVWWATKPPIAVRSKKWLKAATGMGIVGAAFYMALTALLVPQDAGWGDLLYALLILLVGGTAIAAWQSIMSKKAAGWVIVVVLLLFFASDLWELKNPAIALIGEKWNSFSFPNVFTFLKVETIDELASAFRLQVLFWLAVVTVACWATGWKGHTDSLAKGVWALVALVIFILRLGMWIDAAIKYDAPNTPSPPALAQCETVSAEVRTCLLENEIKLTVGQLTAENEFEVCVVTPQGETFESERVGPNVFSLRSTSGPFVFQHKLVKGTCPTSFI